MVFGDRFIYIENVGASAKNYWCFKTGGLSWSLKDWFHCMLKVSTSLPQDQHFVKPAPVLTIPTIFGWRLCFKLLYKNFFGQVLHKILAEVTDDEQGVVQLPREYVTGKKCVKTHN